MEGLQSGIRCVRLNEENILVCGGAQGVVQIWDVSLRKIVSNYEILVYFMSFSYFFNLQIKRFTEKQADSIEHVQFYNKILITGSSMQVLINLIFCVCIVSDLCCLFAQGIRSGPRDHLEHGKLTPNIIKRRNFIPIAKNFWFSIG